MKLLCENQNYCTKKEKVNARNIFENIRESERTEESLEKRQASVTSRMRVPISYAFLIFLGFSGFINEQLL